MICGDDMLNDLLEEMAPSASSSTIVIVNPNISPTPAATKQCQRLIDDPIELLSTSSSSQQLSPPPINPIWNPYLSTVTTRISVPPTTIQSICVALPSIDEEVLRHDAYEQFKRSYYETCRAWTKRPDVAKAFSDDKFRERVKIPWNTILERFHMVTKLEESVLSSSHLNDEDGRATRMDPLLIMSHQLRTQNGFFDGDGGVSTMKDILRDTVEFQLRKLVTNDASSNDNNDEGVLPPSLMNRLLTPISKLVHSTECDFQAQARRTSQQLARQNHQTMLTNTRRTSQRLARQTTNSNPNHRKRKHTSKTKIKIGTSEDGHTHHVTYNGRTQKINTLHYHKLLILHDRHHSQTSSSTATQSTHTQTLDEYRNTASTHLYQLLSRYDALEGAGLQAALPNAVYDHLHTSYHVSMECFASPFNCYYGNYCSLFDIDRFFGSHGSFFAWTPPEAAGGNSVYQANPPFVPQLIDRMARHMLHLLTTANEQHQSLMFIVFVPTWIETQGWQTLKNLPCDKNTHVHIPQNDSHYYCEGTQYRRANSTNNSNTTNSSADTKSDKSRYRVSSFDTSVFYLQNDASIQEWSDLNQNTTWAQRIESLKESFRLLPTNEQSSTLEAGNSHPQIRNALPQGTAPGNKKVSFYSYSIWIHVLMWLSFALNIVVICLIVLPFFNHLQLRKFVYILYESTYNYARPQA